eukprot:TRINITY_DN13729_c0_g1_i1.p1 TRINITY_DN13729_c0_g1~~TRINITY_DN13729_c0_g1_i1.p1  ORF type:complete len:105 (+),score=17.06 TRINITY_DN13729_c0_g1_i1:164-478(+)
MHSLRTLHVIVDMIDNRIEHVSFPEAKAICEQNNPAHMVKGLQRMVNKAAGHGALRVTGTYPHQQIHLVSAPRSDDTTSADESQSSVSSYNSDSYDSDDDSSSY